MSIRWSRFLRGVAGALLVTAPFGPAALAGQLTDAVGDTVDEVRLTPLDAPEADIVESWISVEPAGIVLGVQVRVPTDPRSHPAWVEGVSIIEWDLDTTGDGEADFVADYYSHDGGITGDVYRADDEDGDTMLCDVSAAGYGPRGYTVTVDPACIGSPSRVAYRVSFFHDTGPGNEEAPVAADSSPDAGMTAPVSLDSPAAGTAPPAVSEPADTAPSPPGTPATPAGGSDGEPASPSDAAPPARDAEPPRGALPAQEAGPTGLAATGTASRGMMAFAGVALVLGGLAWGFGASRRPLAG